ncbi:hypothetical protein ACFL20_06580 [Spirochaetota bacterium]
MKKSTSDQFGLDYIDYSFSPSTYNIIKQTLKHSLYRIPEFFQPFFVNINSDSFDCSNILSDINTMNLDGSTEEEKKYVFRIINSTKGLGNRFKNKIYREYNEKNDSLQQLILNLIYRNICNFQPAVKKSIDKLNVFYLYKKHIDEIRYFSRFNRVDVNSKIKNIIINNLENINISWINKFLYNDFVVKVLKLKLPQPAFEKLKFKKKNMISELLTEVQQVNNYISSMKTFEAIKDDACPVPGNELYLEPLNIQTDCRFVFFDNLYRQIEMFIIKKIINDRIEIILEKNYNPETFFTVSVDDFKGIYSLSNTKDYIKYNESTEGKIIYNKLYDNYHLFKKDNFNIRKKLKNLNKIYSNYFEPLTNFNNIKLSYLSCIPIRDPSLILRGYAGSDCMKDDFEQILHPGSVFYKIMINNLWIGYFTLLSVYSDDGKKFLLIDVLNLKKYPGMDIVNIFNTIVNSISGFIKYNDFECILLPSEIAFISNHEWIREPIYNSIRGLDKIWLDVSVRPFTNIFQSLDSRSYFIVKVIKDDVQLLLFKV